MCGRYRLGEEGELRGLIEVMNGRDRAVKISGEVFPTDRVPVIATGRSLRRGVFAMTWGYTLPNGRRVINARSETAAQRPLFRDGMAHRRCAVPASCYYEWDHSGPSRDKYAIAPAEGIAYLAAVYRMEGDEPVFAVLTRAPSEDIAFIHDRMPVILPGALVDQWIDPNGDPSAALGGAVTSVAFERAEPDAAPEAEQIGMQFQEL